MNIQNDTKNKTVIQDERQFKTEKKLINNLPIELTGNCLGEARYIFGNTFKIPEGMEL